MKTILLTVSLLISQLTFAQNSNPLQCYNRPDVSKEMPYLVSLENVQSNDQLKLFIRELTSSQMVEVAQVQKLKALGLTLISLSVPIENLFFPQVLGFNKNAAIDASVEQAAAKAAAEAGISSYHIGCNYIAEAFPKAGGMN